MESDPAYKILVSIHAPTGGATRQGSRETPATACFNPRAYGRRDASVSLKPLCRSRFQSTRLREARRVSGGYIRRYTCFNPRAYGRRDLSGNTVRVIGNAFQSTRLREARHFQSVAVQLL